MDDVYSKGFSYFIIIICIIILFYVTANHIISKRIKSRFNILKATQEKRLKDREFFQKIEMDNDVFYELKERCVKSYASEHRNKMYEEIRDDLEEIFGEDYEQKFDISNGCDKDAWSNPAFPAFWAIQLALAKRGMAHSFYVYGYSLGYGEDIWWKIEMLKKIESYMLEKYPAEMRHDLKLCLKPKSKVVWDEIKNKSVIAQSTTDLEDGLVLCKRSCPTGRRLW